MARGIANGSAKLTDEQVRQIRQLYKPGRESNVAELANAFGITKRYVFLLAHGTWRKTA